MDQAGWISVYSPLLQAATINSSSAMCGTVWASPSFLLELWLAWSYTGLVHSATALWVLVWNEPITPPPSPPKLLTLTISFCDDSQVLRRRDVARISHWGLNIPVFNLCALASGDLSLDHRSTAERSSLMRVLLFFPLTQMQSYCGKQHDFCEKHSS